MKQALTYKPNHQDCCDHGQSAFVGSYQASEPTEPPGKTIDVYFWRDEQGVKHSCLRYGDHPADYISPCAQTLHLYPGAINLIRGARV